MRNYQQWVQFLVDKYPEMIKNKQVIDVGDGWKDLVRLCCENLHHTKVAYNKTHDDKIKSPVVTQVKEKFGGLRFYYDCDDKIKDELEKAFSLVESLSFKICEDCGRPGKTRQAKPKAWIRTLCDNCVINDNKEIKVRSFRPIEEQLKLKRMNHSGIWKIMSDGIGNKSHAQDELDRIIAALRLLKKFEELVKKGFPHNSFDGSCCNGENNDFNEQLQKLLESVKNE